MYISIKEQNWILAQKRTLYADKHVESAFGKTTIQVLLVYSYSFAHL